MFECLLEFISLHHLNPIFKRLISIRLEVLEGLVNQIFDTFGDYNESKAQVYFRYLMGQN